jgi:hypothetical protein
MQAGPDGSVVPIESNTVICGNGNDKGEAFHCEVICLSEIQPIMRINHRNNI